MRLQEIMKIRDESQRSHKMYLYSKEDKNFRDKKELFDFILSIPHAFWKTIAVGDYIKNLKNFKNKEDRFDFISKLTDVEDIRSRAMYELSYDENFQENFETADKLKQYILKIPNQDLRSDAIANYLDMFLDESISEKKSLIKKITNNVIRSACMEDMAKDPDAFENIVERKEYIQRIPIDINRSRAMELVCRDPLRNFDSLLELEEYAFSIPTVEIRSLALERIHTNISQSDFDGHGISQKTAQEKEEAKILTLLASFLNDGNEFISESVRKELKKKPMLKFLDRIQQKYTQRQDVPQLIQKIQNYKKKLIQQKKKSGLQDKNKKSVRVEQISQIDFNTLTVFDIISHEHVKIFEFLQNKEYGKTILFFIRDGDYYKINGYYEAMIKILYICRDITYAQYINKQQTEPIYTLLSFTNNNGDCRIRKIEIQEKLDEGYNVFFVEKESDEEHRIISKSAIQTMNFVGSIHCNHSTLVYRVTDSFKV